MTDPFAQVFETIAWLQIVENESRRTILCPPHLTETIQAIVDRHGVGHLMTVVPSTMLPADSVVVADEQAMDASTRATQQYLLHRWRPFPDLGSVYRPEEWKP